MKKSILVVLLSLTFNLMAMDLDSARSQGKVEELATGYLKAKDPSAEALAQEINAQRKAHYEGVASKTGISVDQVAQQAALKIKEKLGN